MSLNKSILIRLLQISVNFPSRKMSYMSCSTVYIVWWYGGMRPTTMWMECIMVVRWNYVRRKIIMQGNKQLKIIGHPMLMLMLNITSYAIRASFVYLIITRGKRQPMRPWKLFYQLLHTLCLTHTGDESIVLPPITGILYPKQCIKNKLTP